MNDSQIESLEAKLQYLRGQKLGHLEPISVPSFEDAPSERSVPLLHLDYTASAQSLRCIESYVSKLMKYYANTHTETSETGRVSTHLFNQAIQSIRTHVGAGSDSFVIPVGNGATGAIERIQKILGINMSPKGQENVKHILGASLSESFSKKYVVFVGPYEHHSNDVTWQDDALCKFVRIKASQKKDEFTEIDFEDLNNQLAAHPDHIKIGSFSACSNVTGLKTNIQKLGQILKKHGALYFLDYAAGGPYMSIDMERDQIDAIFLSCHKNLGGTNLGLLVAKDHIYDAKVAPTFGGGGTVQAVTPWNYHFHDDIEDREYSGTPAIRQTWTAALSFQIKDWIGTDIIERKEKEIVRSFMDFLERAPHIQNLGNSSAEKRIGVFSFLVNHSDRVLHHNLVAALLNDLFGIQARSGCACAGPFGHDLLSIDESRSQKYIDLILSLKNGFKPGWTRVGIHYTLTETEIEYIKVALSTVSKFGALFINDYKFCPGSGEWKHLKFSRKTPTLRFQDAVSDSLQPNQASFSSNPAEKNDFSKETDDVASIITNKISKTCLTDSTSDELSNARLKQLVKNHMSSHRKEVSEFLKDLSKLYLDDELEKIRNPLEKIFLFSSSKGNKNFSTIEELDDEVRFFYGPSSLKIGPENHH